MPMPLTLSRHCQWQHTLILLMGLVLTFSTALTNIMTVLLLLLVLSESHRRRAFWSSWRHPVVQPAIALLLLLTIAISYSPVPPDTALAGLNKYRELLLIPVLIVLAQDANSRRWGLIGFTGGMMIVLSLSYFCVISGYPVYKGTPEDPSIFRNYLTQNIMMSLATYLLAVQALQQWGWRRWLLITAVLLALFNILFFSAGRTGYVLVACLFLLFMYQCLRWRGAFAGLILLVILGIPAYMSSNVMQHRLDKMITEINSGEKARPYDTSVRLRMEFYENSLHLFWQQPWLGYGTGSFAPVYAQLAEERQLTDSTTNPHNEYLMIALQGGIGGLLLLLGLFFRIWHSTATLSLTERRSAQGLVVFMAVGCLFNSLLLDETEGHLFTFLTGLLYGGTLSSSSRRPESPET